MAANTKWRRRYRSGRIRTATERRAAASEGRGYRPRTPHPSRNRTTRQTESTARLPTRRGNRRHQTPPDHSHCGRTHTAATSNIHTTGQDRTGQDAVGNAATTCRPLWGWRTWARPPQWPRCRTPPPPCTAAPSSETCRRSCRHPSIRRGTRRRCRRWGTLHTQNVTNARTQ